MAGKRSGLGKGLDALFVDNATEDQHKAVSLPLNEIEPNRGQPRKSFDEEALNELADSIAQHGILQPLLVRPMIGGGYQLVAGERRWRAARLAGLAEVPVIIREMSDGETMELALIENLQREDLNVLEEAEGYLMLVETYGLTQEETAKRVGKSRSAVANALRLLALPDSVKEQLRGGKLSAGQARTLLAFSDEEALKAAADAAVRDGLSVRELERRAKARKRMRSIAMQGRIAARDPLYDEVELSLTEHLGRRVKVTAGPTKGTIEIEFYNQDDLKQLANSIVPDAE